MDRGEVVVWVVELEVDVGADVDDIEMKVEEAAVVTKHAV